MQITSQSGPIPLLPMETAAYRVVKGLQRGGLVISCQRQNKKNCHFFRCFPSSGDRRQRNEGICRRPRQPRRRHRLRFPPFPALRRSPVPRNRRNPPTVSPESEPRNPPAAVYWYRRSSKYFSTYFIKDCLFAISCVIRLLMKDAALSSFHFLSFISNVYCTSP